MISVFIPDFIHQTTWQFFEFRSKIQFLYLRFQNSILCFICYRGSNVPRLICRTDLPKTCTSKRWFRNALSNDKDA